MSDKLTIRVEREYEIDIDDWIIERGLECEQDDTKVLVDISQYLIMVSHAEAGDFPGYTVRAGIVDQTAFRVNGKEI